MNGHETILTIDPDLAGSAVAIARGNKLVHVESLRVPRSVRDLETRTERHLELVHKACATCGVARVDTVVGEFPVVYPPPRTVGDPNNEVRLAALVAGIACGLRPSRLLLPTPSNWKGTIPKSQHHKRLAKAHPRAADMVADTNVLAADRIGDMWDAIGLWSWYIERCSVE